MMPGQDILRASRDRPLALVPAIACCRRAVCAGSGAGADIAHQRERYRGGDADRARLRSTIRSRCSPSCSAKLPERVQVYPTENYYYFRFIHDGVRYVGNIRLAAANRDRGEVQFRLQRDGSRTGTTIRPAVMRRSARRRGSRWRSLRRSSIASR